MTPVEFLVIVFVVGLVFGLHYASEFLSDWESRRR